MAASGLAELAEAAGAVEMAMDRKSPRVHLLQLNAIFSGTFDKNTTCSSADIAKCLERLNGALPAAQPYLRTAALYSQKLNGFHFGRETFSSTRLGRSPSTDSIGASNFSSDLGSVDSCHFSSNGSDSNSGSSPCSPEEPDRFSRAGTPQPMPPIPDSLREDSYDQEPKQQKDTRTNDSKNRVHNQSSGTMDVSSVCDGSERISFRGQSNSSSNEIDANSNENIKHFYLQSSCSVPNSNSISSSLSSSSFQRTEREGSTISDKVGSSCISEASCSSSNSSHFKTGKRRVSTNSQIINQSNCSSSNELQRCHWERCESSLEGNAELVEHIRTQHVQLQKDKESFVCLWDGCKVYNRASCSLSWLERHVLSHGGNKPFKCIVDNCSQRFPTQAALQRHVNSHFENSHSSQGKANNSKCRDDSSFPSKSFRRKKHLKYKKRSAHGTRYYS